MTLVNTDCTQSLACTQYCWEWKRKETRVLTLGGNTLKSCGVGVVELSVGTTLSIAVEVLVVDLIRYLVWMQSNSFEECL